MVKGHIPAHILEMKKVNGNNCELDRRCLSGAVILYDLGLTMQANPLLWFISFNGIKNSNLIFFIE